MVSMPANDLQAAAVHGAWVGGREVLLSWTLACRCALGCLFLSICNTSKRFACIEVVCCAVVTCCWCHVIHVFRRLAAHFVTVINRVFYSLHHPSHADCCVSAFASNAASASASKSAATPAGVQARASIDFVFAAVSTWVQVELRGPRLRWLATPTSFATTLAATSFLCTSSITSSFGVRMPPTHSSGAYVYNPASSSLNAAWLPHEQQQWRSSSSSSPCML
jgi:hypothetical protein